MRTFLFLFIVSLPFSTIQSQTDTTKSYVQLCLLLDVSGSMDGLKNQAQNQIWNAMNTVKNFKLENKPTEIEVAIVTYGNAYNDQYDFVDILSNFNSDIDSIAATLFLIATGGGQEYCGAAIYYAINNLKWIENDSVFKTIIIAGNEPFNQGEIDYKTVCEKAKNKKIRINTIYCGDFEEGKSMYWENGANIGNGQYMNINQDIENEAFRSPYDNKIISIYNDYVSTYSEKNYSKVINSLGNYYNSEEVAPAYRDFVIYKFKNSTQNLDFIDSFSNSNYKLAIPQWQIPVEWKDMPETQIKMKFFRVAQQREVSKKAMELYIEKLEDFLHTTIGEKMKEKTLDTAINKILEEQLIRFGFKKNEK